MSWHEALAGEPGRPALLIGHRGVRRGARENTLPAFERAQALGAHGIEFDVRRTRDGQWVLLHDRAYWRGGRRRVLGQMSHTELPGWMPTLAEALDWARRRHRLLLDVEIKEGEGVAQVAEALAPLAGRAVITSFFSEALQGLGPERPDLPLGLILPTRGGDHLRNARRSGASFVVVRDRALGGPFVQALRRDGLGLAAWDVNSVRRLRTLRSWGVGVVITDRLRVLAGGNG